MTASADFRGHMSPEAPAISKPRGSNGVEVLPALLSKNDLRPMIRDTRRYARSFRRSGLLLATSLRRLADAGAHTTYGRKSFAEWAAHEFSDLDLTPDAIKKLSAQGRVMLVLERYNRIALSDPSTFPGTSGARILSAVLSAHSEDDMLRVWDHCPAGHVVAETARRAAQSLLPSPPATRAQPLEPDDVDQDEDEVEECPRLRDLRMRIDRLHDYLYEISLADDPIMVRRSYRDFLEDAEGLRAALAAVLPAKTVA